MYQMVRALHAPRDPTIFHAIMIIILYCTLLLSLYRRVVQMIIMRVVMYVCIIFFLKAMWSCMCFALPCVKYNNNNEIITYIDIILYYIQYTRSTRIHYYYIICIADIRRGRVSAPERAIIHYTKRVKHIIYISTII